MAKARGTTKTRKSKPNGQHDVAASPDVAAVTMTGPDGKVIFQGTDEEFTAAARLVTHGANGNISETHTEPVPEPISIGEAMRQAVSALGDITIDPDLAASQLRQLAEAYEEVASREAAFKAKNEEAKTAKKSLDSATELLLSMVKEFTHSSALPLFDAQEREAEHANMLDAAEA